MEADTQLLEEEGEEGGELDASPFANLVASMCGGGPPAAQQEPTTERSSLSRSEAAWQLGLCRIHFSIWVRIRPRHSLEV
jgi:hypothetical protein